MSHHFSESASPMRPGDGRRPTTSRVVLASRVLAVGLAVFASGCSVLEPRPDPTEYFVLRPIETTKIESKPRLTIGVGPISLPSYLDRPQIVRRAGGNRVEVDEFERWAEPLRAAVPRVLGQNLENHEHIGHTIAYPWAIGTPLDLAVEVDITHFETTSDGVAELAAHWMVRRGKEMIVWHDSSIARQAVGSGTEACVGAMDQSLDALAGEIAEALVHAGPAPH